MNYHCGTHEYSEQMREATTPTESLLSSSPTLSDDSELDYVQVSSFQPSFHLHSINFLQPSEAPQVNSRSHLEEGKFGQENAAGASVISSKHESACGGNESINRKTMSRESNGSISATSIPKSIPERNNVQNQILSGIDIIMREIVSLRSEMNQNQMDNKNQIIDISVQLAEIQSEVLAWNENSLDLSEIDEDQINSGFGDSSCVVSAADCEVSNCQDGTDYNIDQHIKHAFDSNGLSRSEIQEMESIKNKEECGIVTVSGAPNSSETSRAIESLKSIAVSVPPNDNDDIGMPPLISVAEADAELEAFKADDIYTYEKLEQVVLSQSNCSQRREDEKTEHHTSELLPGDNTFSGAINPNDDSFIDGSKVNWKCLPEQSQPNFEDGFESKYRQLVASYEEDCRRYIQTGYYSQCSPTQNIQVAIDGVQRLVTSDHAEESQRITTEDKFAALKLRRRFYQLEKLEHLERTKVNQELLDDKDNLRVHFYKHQDNIPAANDAYSLWRKEEKVALKLEKVEAKNFKFSTTPQIDSLLDDLKFDLNCRREALSQANHSASAAAVEFARNQQSNDLHEQALLATSKKSDTAGKEFASETSAVEILSLRTTTFDVPIPIQSSKQEKFFSQVRPTVYTGLPLGEDERLRPEGSRVQSQEEEKFKGLESRLDSHTSESSTATNPPRMIKGRKWISASRSPSPQACRNFEKGITTPSAPKQITQKEREELYDEIIRLAGTLGFTNFGETVRQAEEWRCENEEWDRDTGRESSFLELID